MIRRGLIVISLLFLANIARAQPLADRVPGDAILYLGWQGSASMPPAYAQSHLKAFLDSSRFPELFSEFFPRLAQRVGMEDKQAAETMNRIAAIAGPLSRHPTALAISPIDFGPNPQPKVAILCQAGNESDALLQQLGDLAAMAPPGAPPLRASKIGDLVVFTFGYPDANAAIADDASKSLSANEAFKTALAQAGKQPVVMFYANVDVGFGQVIQALNTFHPADSADVVKFLNQSGLQGLKSMVWTGSFDGPNWSEHAFLAAPAPRMGLLAMLDSPPLSTALFKSIPKGATWATGTHLDLAAFLNLARDILVKTNPDEAKNLDMGLGMGQAMLGFNVQTDLLEALGSEWAIYTDPAVAGSGWTGFVLVNHLRKPDLANKSLKKLWLALDNMINAQMPKEDKMRINFETTKSGDLEVNYVGIPVVSPSWAIRDDTLYIALFPQIVVSADAAAKGPSLLDNPDFQALRQHLGGQNATDFSFSDLPRSVSDGYQTMLVMLQIGTGFADMAGAKTPAMVLPPLHLIRKEVNPAAEFAWSDDAGYHYRGQTPFPGAETIASQSNFMVAYAGLVTSITLPALNAAKERANRVKCASNLRQIGQGCLLYANDHKGSYPPDLGTLVLNDLNVEVFVCPSGNTDVPLDARNDPKKGAAWVNEHADYVYLGAGKRDGGNPEIIICYEKMENHENQGMNILFNDGHVAWFAGAAGMDLVNKQLQAEGVKGDKL
jgi:prepilin-type processing-associated H-X9-DG protein